MPDKPKTDNLNEHIEYCNKLINIIKKDESLYVKEDIRIKTNLLEEIVNDDVEELNSMIKEDAKVGHKSADTSFFGYKTSISMTPERIVTAVVVTTGDKHDGKQAKELIEKSIENGIEVEVFIGDGAYSEKENILLAKEKEIKLVSKLSKTVTEGNRKPFDGFEYNKDADRFNYPYRYVL